MNVFYLVVPLSLDMLHDLSDKRLMEVRGLVKCAVISHNAPCTTHSKRGSLRNFKNVGRGSGVGKTNKNRSVLRSFQKEES